MIELIDIIDQNENILHQASKEEAHKMGWAHWSVHLWIVNKNKEILIQKRSKTKDTYPNLWDVSVAGHVNSGENFKTAALRECKEEIGLKLKASDLLLYGKNHKQIIHNPRCIDHEFQKLFICKINFELNQVQLQNEEVSEIQLLNFETLISKLESKDSGFVPRSHDYIKLLTKQLPLL